MTGRALLLILTLFILTGCDVEMKQPAKQSRPVSKTSTSKSTTGNKANTKSGKNAAGAAVGAVNDAAALKNEAEKAAMTQQIVTILKTVTDLPTAQAADAKIAKFADRWADSLNSPGAVSTSYSAIRKMELAWPNNKSMNEMEVELRRISSISPKCYLELKKFHAAWKKVAFESDLRTLIEAGSKK